jgi:hypothetical protein
MSEMATRVSPDYLTPIRNVLRDREMTPSELIGALSNQFSDEDIRVAVWYLISQNELELSADQKLRLTRAA